ncbi:hypothetical protein [Streptomyces sp. t39]|uniref:hypothetical protein n=1 Tax=Streptomyces sp. t39 TaxID=1828156 RepID=UPI0011CE646A|nr:hypothetical protein [Streptomyces sp. t39]TXS57141.1 hypothetical protein EAO77_14390 [Streptomyces sp. t39]
MLALRLARGAHPLVQLRRLMVAAASAGVGFLLLCALTYALSHPADSRAATLRLLWCLVPLAATVYFAVSVARTDPGTRPQQGLSAVGLGPARLGVTAAVTTAVAATLGSAVALLFFLHLRGDISGLPFDGAAADLLAAEESLPLGAALTLLALVPLTATAAAAVALRPGPGESDGDADAPASTPSGLPWGVALVAAGLAVETYASGRASGTALPLPGQGAGHPAGVLVGWTLTATGLWLAGPALTHLCGRLLQAFRPGATRLLAGRILMQEARRVGRPLGVVCAVGSGAVAAFAVYGGVPRPWGPLTVLGAVLVVTCTTAVLLTAVVEARRSRAGVTDALLRIGAQPTALRRVAALRVVALLVVFAPLTWLVASLAAAPLKG